MLVLSLLLTSLYTQTGRRVSSSIVTYTVNLFDGPEDDLFSSLEAHSSQFHQSSSCAGVGVESGRSFSVTSARSVGAYHHY